MSKEGSQTGAGSGSESYLLGLHVALHSAHCRDRFDQRCALAKEPRELGDRSRCLARSLPRKRYDELGLAAAPRHLHRPSQTNHGSDRQQPRATGSDLSVVPIPVAKASANPRQTRPYRRPSHPWMCRPNKGTNREKTESRETGKMGTRYRTRSLG